MSEGILRKKDRLQSYLSAKTERESCAIETVVVASRTSDPSSSSPRASTPRAGALIVEAYSKITERNRGSSPEKVLLEYVVFLLKKTERGKEAGCDISREIQSLAEAIDVAISFNCEIISWDPGLLSALFEFIDTYSKEESKVLRLQKILRNLYIPSVFVEEQPPNRTTSFLSSPNNNGMSSLVSSIADRISLSDDRSSAIALFLSELGPSCTRSKSTFREILSDFARTSGPIDEEALAGLVYFFSDKWNQSDNNGAGLSSALLGSMVVNRGPEGGLPMNSWNVEVVAQILNDDYSNRDWTSVTIYWDTSRFKITDSAHFRGLIDLFRAGANRVPHVGAFTGSWRNTTSQLSCLESMISVPPNVFTIPLNDEELADAATASLQGSNPVPNPQFWASIDILQRLLQLSDIPGLYRRVRDLFVRCLMTCPEVLLCSLVRLQLRVANASQREQGSDSLVTAGMQIKTELMRELIPLFFRPSSHHTVMNGPGAIRRLYSISPTTVMAACFEAWRSTSQESSPMRLTAILHIINIARLLPSPADAVANLLSGSRDAEYSIAIAFVMADNEYLQLKPWLAEKLSSTGSVAAFAVSLVSYLRKTYNTAGPKIVGQDRMSAPLVSVENMSVSLSLLQSLDANVLAQTVTGLDRSLSSGPTLGENVRSLTEICLSTHPSLRSSVSLRAPPNQNSASDDVEEMATAYFQKIYTSEQSIGEVVEMLKRFKTSGNVKENEIFACMVHNLFDEYRFFAKYPEKELRITGILFGALIQEQLVSSITLGIALRYVLEALRKPPSPLGVTTSSGKMFKFGMFALEQFKGRLHEWPQYCSHIVQIPHLKEGYADLVAEIEQEMSKNQNHSRSAPSSSMSAPVTQKSGSATNEAFALHPEAATELQTPPLTTITSLPPSVPDPIISISTRNMAASGSHSIPPPKPRVAEFGRGLGRAVTEGVDEEHDFEAPTDAMLDKVQFLVNNLAPSNVEKKAAELKEMLDPKCFGWLGHFLVVKRISTQANFHSLYLSFLDHLGEYGKGLVEAILSSVYRNIGKLLRSPKITTSSSERSYLKNLGIWLGQITLSRNRPILQVMLDCKELLLQGYETGKLIAVAPFLAKTLEGAKNSVVFRPPNPWLMGLLGVFRAVYNVEGLKMNIKFEVEVLCKNLGIKLEEIPVRAQLLTKRIAPIKERNPDFNIKTSSTQKTTTPTAVARSVVASPEAQPANLSTTRGDESGRATPSSLEQQETVIPNLATYVTVNPSLSQLLQSQGGSVLANLTSASLKRWVPIAVDRAIREIIQPVVERSVTIACITTKEIVTKDFAMESDEARMRKAGQLMVANLAGSLALVTCREPLRSSVSSHLRQLLSSNVGRAETLGEQEQNVIEQCVQICATDNLELGCRLIEKAATEKAVRDVDEALSPALNARRKHREQTGQPFYDMSIFSNGGQRYPASLPDQLRPKPGGLQSEHFQLYESFQRMPRQSQPFGSAAAAPPSSGLVPVRTGTPASNGLDEAEIGQTMKVGSNPQATTDILATITAKLDAAVTALLSAAGTRARDIKLSMLPPDHQICQLLSAIKQVVPNSISTSAASRPLSVSEQDIVLGFSQGVFKRLYELSLNEPLRLEVFVAVLENINVFCPKLGKDIGTWATYAPTNTEQQRRLHRTMLLLLVRSRLLAVHELDNFLAARADLGRNHVWIEFSLVFLKTAFEKRIATPSDFPKLLEIMTRIANGSSQATPQVAQALQKPILQMLDEMRPPSLVPEQSTITVMPIPSISDFPLSENSSLSFDSLTRLFDASAKIAESTESFSKADPPNARQQVTALLDGWIRIQSDQGGNDKSLVQYLQVLQQVGVGRLEDQTERFLRLSSLAVVDAAIKSASLAPDGTRLPMNYHIVDLYSKLLQVLFRHMNSGGTAEQVDVQRLAMLNKILGVIVRSMVWHSLKGSNWDQRPWFRILMNFLIDVNKPEPIFDSIRLGILSLFSAAFHSCQPLVMPRFAFAWLELVSHRHFLPNVLLFPAQKGWNIGHQLLVDLFLFLEPYLRKVELNPAIKKLYEGTLRVLLVLLHDFPSFLASFHLSLCNIIPENCVQLRNIVLSASPKGMATPDPFTPNLKIDLLPETSQSPTILSNVLGPIDDIRSHLDAYLNEGSRRGFLAGLLSHLYAEGSSEVNQPKVHSLVVYVGAHALARLQSPQISLSRTPDIELFQTLMEFDDRGRYVCLNAIANQLRYPSSHTHYFSCVMLYLFSESKTVAVKEQVTRVLLERLIVNRPHPWGLLITFIELIKNQRYGFWSYPFTRCATEIEKVFETVARSCMPPGTQRSALVVGDDHAI